MIDDRITSLDPVCLFPSKETSARWASPNRSFSKAVWKEGGCSNSCAFIWVVASQEVRSYPVSWLCRKK
ncbi:hypothetical protein AMECASPLE_009713 [Ameca splendens]|uniref:Uncharacterized protein n=1 Tax=Ameca splendens TaxID=208324 RepID=A0ABV0ZKV7_9TELE